MTDSRQDAYVGWLVTNRQFLAELRRFREAWEPAVRRIGRFPLHPSWPFLHEQSFDGVPAAFTEDCFGFYRRWGLRQMLTWDWPVPMEPKLTGGPVRDLHLLSDTGVILFIPWYLLRGEKLNVQQIVQANRTVDGPEHLREWLFRQKGRPEGGLDDVRYERLRWLYRFYELVLNRRYPEQIKGNVQNLDATLGKLIGRDEDSVMKLRLELRRSLHQASE